MALEAVNRSVTWEQPENPHGLLPADRAWRRPSELTPDFSAMERFRHRRGWRPEHR
jgi:hypothetical protein